MDNERLKIYYDAEFTELTADAQLISIGLYSESGAYFYAEFELDTSTVETLISDDFMMNNVISNLLFWNSKATMWSSVSPSDSDDNPTPYNILMKGTADDIKDNLIQWLENERIISEKIIEFYTDCYAYDWVLLNQLICKDGNALNIPGYISYIPIDLSTALRIYGIDPDITREEYISFTDKEDILNMIDLPIGDNKPFKHNALWDALVTYKCFQKVLYVNKIEGEEVKE